MGVTDLSAITSSGFTNTNQTTASNELGKETFMKLLIEELKNQDPLNPTDSKDFTVQLAQFTSLEKLENIDGSIQNLSLYQMSATNATAVNLIGKQVEAIGKSIVVKDGDATGISYKLTNDLKNMKMNIYDKDGNLVNSINLGDKNEGSYDYEWNAKRASGTTVDDGIYTFSISGENALGESVTVDAKIIGTVDSVSFDNGTAILSLDGREVSLADIIAIKEISAAAADTTAKKQVEEAKASEKLSQNREYSRQRALYLNSLGLPLVNSERNAL